jgi:hypothetical protein
MLTDETTLTADRQTNASSDAFFRLLRFAGFC